MQPIPEEFRYFESNEEEASNHCANLFHSDWISFPDSSNNLLAKNDQHPNQVFEAAFNEAPSGPISQNNNFEKEGELSTVDSPLDSPKPGESGTEYSESYISKLEVT